ncbi:hypothetical protein WAJ27_18395 [Acinetobacter baumannii]
MKLVPVRGMIQAYVQASTSSNKAFSLYGFFFSLLYCCFDSPIKQASLFCLCFSSQPKQPKFASLTNLTVEEEEAFNKPEEEERVAVFLPKQNRMQPYLSQFRFWFRTKNTSSACLLSLL